MSAVFPAPEMLAATCVAAGVVCLYVGGRVERARRHNQRVAAARDATTDSVTGLPNRAALLEHLGARATAGRAGSVIMLGLEPFTELTGERGRDQVLRQVGQRLAATVYPYGLAARLGDDEFAAVVPDTDLDVVGWLVRGVLDAIAAPIPVEVVRAAPRRRPSPRPRPPDDAVGEPVTVSTWLVPLASVGIALPRLDGETTAQQVHRASEALTMAKAGSAGVVLWTEPPPAPSPLEVAA